MVSHARVVIVGGGMMGVGLLYHLAEEGWSDCVLIEKDELTSGSTWHAAGQCPSFIGEYSMAMVHHYGNTLYPKLEEMTGQSTGWHGSGGIRLATTQEEVNWFHHVKSISKNVGYRMEIISPEECRRINPFLEDTTGVLAGAWTLDDGHVDPSSCCNAMAIAARRMGGTIIRHTLVTNIKQLPSGEWEVVTNKGSIICEHVVNAGGCYADRIGAWVGVNVPISNMKHQYLVTDALKEFMERDDEMVVMRDPYCSAYYRQEQKSGLIGIYERSDSREAWLDTGGQAWDSAHELFPAEFDPIMSWLERVMERMPIFRDAGIKRVVNGAITHSPDGNPLVGPAGGARNFWLSCGSSIGIAQGAGCGKYLAQWMVHGAAEINMMPLDPRRFGPYADQAYTSAKSHQDYTHMYAPALPGEQRPAGRPARTSTLYEKLVAKGCVHTEAFGWERPQWFSLDGREENWSFRRNNIFEVIGEECKAVRERVGILDLSSFSKFEVSGSGAAKFLNRLCANRVSRRTGGIVLTHGLTDKGFIESEFTITRLAKDRFYLLSGASAQIRDLDLLTQGKNEGEDVEIRDITDDYGVLVVAGPRSRDVLSQLTETDLSNDNFRWLTGKEIELAGVNLRALRVNYVGELGWELHVPMADLETVYDAVWAAGEAHGIADFGVYAVNSLRIEKGYRGWSVELTNEITMIEADMERFVKYKKDFVGRDALLKRREEDLVYKIVYLEMEVEDADVRGGETVLDGDKPIGIATSGGYGYAVGKSLAYAYVNPAYAKPGTTFEIDVLGSLCKATVLAEPVYDAQNERMRA